MKKNKFCKCVNRYVLTAKKYFSGKFKKGLNSARNMIMNWKCYPNQALVSSCFVCIRILYVGIG